MENKIKSVLYVLKLPQMDENENLGYMIKFGYSEDFDKRMKSGYNAYHRFVKVLHVYTGFTREDEARIKYHLKEYLMWGGEWYYEEEVTKFFDTYDTNEKLREKIDTLFYSQCSSKFYKVNYQYPEFIIEHSYKDCLRDLIKLQDKRDKLFRILREFTPEEQIRYIIFTYNTTREELEEWVNNKNRVETTEKACELALEFNELGDSCKKLTMLVDLKSIEGITEKDISSFLELIQPKYKEYYTIMGPDFIRQFSCKESEIKREWLKRKSNDDLREEINLEIYKTFEIGKRYTKAEIKAVLNELYQKLGYNKTAKATDLEEYFVLKPVLTSDKKAGFELLDKK